MTLAPFARSIEPLGRATNEIQKRETFVVLAATAFWDDRSVDRLRSSCDGRNS
jgi:hypothetical protein